MKKKVQIALLLVVCFSVVAGCTPKYNYSYPENETDYTVSMLGGSSILINNVEQYLNQVSIPVLNKKVGTIERADYPHSPVVHGDYVYYILLFYYKDSPWEEFVEKMKNKSVPGGHAVMRVPIQTGDPEVLFYFDYQDVKTFPSGLTFADEDRLIGYQDNIMFLYNVSTGLCVKEKVEITNIFLKLFEDGYYAGIDEKGELFYCRVEGDSFVKKHFGVVKKEGWTTSTNVSSKEMNFETKVADEKFFYRFKLSSTEFSDYDEGMPEEAVYSIEDGRLLYSKNYSEHANEKPYGFEEIMGGGRSLNNREKIISYHGKEYIVGNEPYGVILTDESGETCYELSVEHCKEISPAFVQCALYLGEHGLIQPKKGTHYTYPSLCSVYDAHGKLFVQFTKRRESMLDIEHRFLFEWRPEEDKILYVTNYNENYDFSTIRLNEE